jgi:hypothetical protein
MLSGSVFQLRCFLGFHRRSRRQVVERDKRLWTACSRCGVGMVRDHRRKWITIKADANKGSLGAAIPWIALVLTLIAAAAAILLAIPAIR